VKEIQKNNLDPEKNVLDQNLKKLEELVMFLRQGTKLTQSEFLYLEIQEIMMYL